ncbi:hypothetical protein C8J56DRAFT_1076284 [Mycena floridula]|nr:hypothetical protein C8J56DRAFT_1076284 [Mycena floridula]
MTEIQKHILLTAEHPSAVASEIQELYDDLLELVRPGMYKLAIQRKMVGILWTQIDGGNFRHLTEAVARWHDVETLLLFASLFQDIRQVLAGSISNSPTRDPLSKLGMMTVVRLIHFICEVAKVSGSKCRAILDAGLICLLHELPTYISYLQLNSTRQQPGAVQKRIMNVIWSQIDSGDFHDLVPAMRHQNTSEIRTFLSEFLNAKCMVLSEAKSIAAAKPVLVSLVHLVQLITRLGCKNCNASIDRPFIPLLPQVRNELISETVVHLTRVRGKNLRQVLYILRTGMFRMSIYRHDGGQPSDYPLLWSSTGYCDGTMTLAAPCFASFHISTCSIPVIAGRQYLHQRHDIGSVDSWFVAALHSTWAFI